MEYHGIILSVSAPSGAGKTSLVNALRERLPNLAVSVSHTTRKKRPNEVDGEHYHFVTESEFKRLIAEDAFAEHAQVFDHHYGTSKAELARWLSQGRDVVLDIDWQGARSAKKLFPLNAVGVFILPPSKEALEFRLRGRGQDEEAVIQSRLEKATHELAHYNEYDYLIVNDDFNEALRELEGVVLAERCRLNRQCLRHQSLLDELLASGR
ncbi:MAG: guanylate kinase [Gammaproteobacteria bacterium]|nr:guanylate kinase [Gammaproteobacteria bacterium]